MSVTNNGSGGTTPRPFTEIGPKHLTPETTEKVLAYERVMCRQLPIHHIKIMQEMFRALLRMVECDAQLAQQSVDHAQVKFLLGDIKGILAGDNGTMQSTTVLAPVDLVTTNKKW
jgi:hypothetical protein